MARYHSKSRGNYSVVRGPEMGQAMTALALRGRHRSVGSADLVIAAIAERTELTLLSAYRELRFAGGGRGMQRPVT